MKTKSTPFKILLTLLFLLAVTTIKAQTISTLGGLTTGTLAVYCPSDQVKLNAASTGAVSYVWQRYTGTTATGTPTTLTGTTANLVDVPTAPGYYTYVSIGSNADGCTSVTSDPATIYVLPGINVSIASNITGNPSGPISFCTNNVPTGAAAITLTATATTTPTVPESFAYTYQWFKGTTAITGATTATYTLTSPGDAVVGTNAYTVQVSFVIKSCTPGISNPINVTVDDVPGKPVITVVP